jgi:hypothetical protein
LIVTVWKDTITVQSGFKDDLEISSEMGLFRRKVPRHFIPIHRDNIASMDWIILLEAGTIVGHSPEKLRVAAATQERKIVKKYNAFLRKQYFLVLEGFDPRIHTLYFCPQLYQLDSDNKLVPLAGEVIGKLLAQTVQDGVVDKRPWYEPLEAYPLDKPINPNNVKDHFESLTVPARVDVGKIDESPGV